MIENQQERYRINLNLIFKQMKSFNEIEITVYRGVKDRIGHILTYKIP